MNTTPPPPAGFVRLVTWLGGAGFLLFGIWALVGPQSFFDTLATFEPYNPHFIHDLGAFQIGLGAVLLLHVLPVSLDGLAAALFGVGTGAAAHVVSHLVDRDLGGTPVTDIPTFTVLAVALLVAGELRRREVAGSDPQ